MDAEHSMKFHGKTGLISMSDEEQNALYSKEAALYLALFDTGVYNAHEYERLMSRCICEAFETKVKIESPRSYIFENGTEFNKVFTYDR